MCAGCVGEDVWVAGGVGCGCGPHCVQCLRPSVRARFAPGARPHASVAASRPTRASPVATRRAWWQRPLTCLRPPLRGASWSLPRQVLRRARLAASASQPWAASTANRRATAAGLAAGRARVRGLSGRSPKRSTPPRCSRNPLCSDNLHGSPPLGSERNPRARSRRPRSPCGPARGPSLGGACCLPCAARGPGSAGSASGAIATSVCALVGRSGVR